MGGRLNETGHDRGAKRLRENDITKNESRRGLSANSLFGSLYGPLAQQNRGPVDMRAGATFAPSVSRENFSYFFS